VRLPVTLLARISLIAA